MENETGNAAYPGGIISGVPAFNAENIAYVEKSNDHAAAPVAGVKPIILDEDEMPAWDEETIQDEEQYPW